MVMVVVVVVVVFSFVTMCVCVTIRLSTSPPLHLSHLPGPNGGAGRVTEKRQLV